MKILVFGASGAIGQEITAELLRRGHSVVGVTRTAAPVEGLDVQFVQGDAADAASVAVLAQGVDAVVSAVGPRRGSENDEESLVGAARGLVEGLRLAGTRRLIVVGGAGSLEVAPGQRLVDTPDFHPAWKPAALAHARALDEIYRAADDLDWTYVSPAAVIEPGERTGSYRTGGAQLLTDEAGDSRISIPDYAIAIADLLDSGGAVRRRITVAH
jgi:putative NADH-flavin reductase